MNECPSESLPAVCAMNWLRCGLANRISLRLVASLGRRSPDGRSSSKILVIPKMWSVESASTLTAIARQFWYFITS